MFRKVLQKFDSVTLTILLLILMSLPSLVQAQEVKGTPGEIENTIASEKENIETQIGERKKS